MTPSEFISETEEAWGKELSVKQTTIWRRKLDRFDSFQIDKLFEKVVETQRYFPNTLEPIWSLARDLGFFREQDTQSRTTTEHTWKPTSCQLCGGDGRLTVFFSVMYEDTDEGRKTVKTLRRIFRASDGASLLAYKPDSTEYDFLYRCPCPAGEASKLPKKWPRWKGSEFAYKSLAAEEKAEEEIPF